MFVSWKEVGMSYKAVQGYPVELVLNSNFSKNSEFANPIRA